MIPHTPTHISKLCVFSAYAFLLPAFICIFSSDINHWINIACLIGLVVTSHYHWTCPIWNSSWHKWDRVLIIINVFWSGYNAYLISWNHLLFYLGGLTIALLSFIFSGYVYDKKIGGPTLDHNIDTNIHTISPKNILYGLFDYSYTENNTISREEAYYTSIIIHGVGIHVCLGIVGAILAVEAIFPEKIPTLMLYTYDVGTQIRVLFLSACESSNGAYIFSSE